MDETFNRIVSSLPSEKVIKVLRSDANKERDKNGKKKQLKKDNEEHIEEKQSIEDQVILSDAGNYGNKAVIQKDTEQQQKIKNLKAEKPTEDEQDDSNHVDIKA